MCACMHVCVCVINALVLYISLLHTFYELSGINFYRWLLREFNEISRTNSGR